MNIRPIESTAIRKKNIYQILVPLLIALLFLSACTPKSESPQETAGEQTDESESALLPAEQIGEEETLQDGEVDSTSEPTPSPSAEQLPEESAEPTPFPMFDIIDGRTIMLSITEEEFMEYAEFLRRELNLNDASLAGILSNIQGESGFNPNKVGDMGNAYGLCQWRGPRLDQMIRFCEENDLNPVTKEGQLRFLVHDLKEVYIYAYDLIRLCNDSEEGARQATFYFCAYYEVPSDPEKESAAREELTELLIYPRLTELNEEKNA